MYGTCNFKTKLYTTMGFSSIVRKKNGSTSTKILHCFKVKQKVRIALKPYSNYHTFIDNTVYCFPLSFIFVQVQLKVKTK